MRYNAVIIGSGVSGMTAAIILAKEGWRVLVLEQHSQPGGLMQHFRRQALVFPTGVHRLGSLDDGQILSRYFQYLGVLDKLSLMRMSSDGFEEYSFPGLRFRVPIGQEAFRERLYQYFPGEKVAIDQFVTDMHRLVSQFPLYNLVNQPESSGLVLESEPLASYLDKLSCSRELKGILSANNPLYGIPPGECPLHTHFLVTDSFLNSSWRVDEYTTPLAETFTKSFLAQGGEIRCNALVTNISTSEGRAEGVVLANEECIPTDLVIFTGHPHQILNLCPPGSFRPAFRHRLEDTQDTFGAFALALSWRHPDCTLVQCDTFIYSSWDTEAQYRQKLVSLSQSPSMVYCCAMPQKSNTEYAVTALVGVAPEEMAPFELTRRGERSEAYQAAKRSLASRTLNVLQEHWPVQAPYLKMVDACTPLTFRDYTLTPRGTAYGIIKSANNFRHAQLSTDTKVKNLFLAGQSIIQPGVLGALISGVYACTAILGRNYLMNKIKEETS
ncbi:MAG: phytoene desaturase family protein [Desulfobaccales bacterium]